MRMYYTLADFLKLNIDVSEYQRNEIMRNKELANEVSKFHPATMMIEVCKDKETGQMGVEHTHVFLDLPNLEYKVRINYMSYSKHYVISAYQGYCNLEYLTTSDRYEHDETNKLNKIGKLSAKKIQAYIDAIASTYKTLTQLSKERVEKVEAFKKKLEGLPVNYWREEKSGSIRKGGLVYEFAIEDSGYISEKIRVDFTSNLDDFLKMSDNKF